MQWDLLPPLMIDSPRGMACGALEPAYQIAGDAFDYAINDRYLAPWIFRRIARTTILAVAGNVTVGILLALAGGSARAEVGGDAVASTEKFSFGIVSMKA